MNKKSEEQVVNINFNIEEKLEKCKNRFILYNKHHENLTLEYLQSNDFKEKLNKYVSEKKIILESSYRNFAMCLQLYITVTHTELQLIQESIDTEGIINIDVILDIKKFRNLIPIESLFNTILKIEDTIFLNKHIVNRMCDFQKKITQLEKKFKEMFES